MTAIATISAAIPTVRLRASKHSFTRLTPDDAALLQLRDASRVPGQAALAKVYFSKRLGFGVQHCTFTFRQGDQCVRWQRVMVGLMQKDWATWQILTQLGGDARAPGLTLLFTIWADADRKQAWLGPADTAAAWAAGPLVQPWPQLFTANDLLAQLEVNALDAVTQSRLHKALRSVALELSLKCLSLAGMPWIAAKLLRKLALELPKAETQGLASADAVQRLWRYWPHYQQVEQQTPTLLTTLYCVNAGLPRQQQLSSAQALRAHFDAHQQLHPVNLPIHPWRMLVKHGHRLLRPFLQVPCRRVDGASWVTTALRTQVLHGDGRLPPPWFLRSMITLHQRGNINALGAGGWLQLSAPIYKAAVGRAFVVTSPASRTRLIQQLELLVALGKCTFLDEACQQGGWNALMAAATHKKLDADTATFLLAQLHMVPLQTLDALDEEGKAMRHCLSTENYAEEFSSGNFAFYSIRHADSRKRLATATLAFDRGLARWAVETLVGIENAACSRALFIAMAQFAAGLAAPEF